MGSNDRANELHSDAAFAELLGKAPPRVSPPEIVEAEIRRAIHAEWRAVTGKRSRRRQMVSFALAASVLLAVFASLGLLRQPLADFTALELASIDRKFGDVTIIPQGEAIANSVASIEGGDVVETGDDSGMALGWHDGGSLRLDENTIVVFEAANQVYLQRGRVYFDSVDFQSPSAAGDVFDFLIRTDNGVVRHLGTQYMTEITAAGMTVSVREGRVSIAGEQGNRRAVAGEQLAITASGAFAISSIESFDEQWRWIEKTTPPIDLHGRPVARALNWVSRESGYPLVFASENAAVLAETSELRGMQGQLDLQPSRALEIFMLTVDLDARFEDGRIIVSEVTRD
jgi:ferric-dicitrate binding protein FerR (iron transport regulator)